MNEKVIKTDLVIVGGGTAGLLLAMLLGRRGIRVTLVERNREIQAHHRGEILQPNGLKILEREGLLQDVRAHGYEANVFHFLEMNGDFLCDIRYDLLPLPYRYALIADPYPFQELLLQKAKETGKVEILFETEFRELLSNNDQVTGIRASRNGKTVELSSKMVIGADGGRSEVRKALGIRAFIYQYRDGYFTARLERPSEGFNQDARYYVGNRKILALFPVSTRYLYLLYLVPGRTPEPFKKGSLADWKKELIAIDPVIEKSLEQITSWEQVHYMPCYRIRTSTWIANGAALLGDAAHSFNPHVAQGRNQGMEDAVALADTLELCFKNDDFSRVSLLPYEEARKKTAEIYERLGNELTLFWNAGVEPLVWIRNRVFRQLNRKPALMYKMLTTVSGIKIDLFTLRDKFRALGVYPGP